MAGLTRRGSIAATLASGAVRGVSQLAKAAPTRRILTLVYDKAAGAMRAVERVVH